MKLVKQIRDVVSEAGNIVRQFVVDSVKADASYSLRDVKKEIKTLTDEVMQIYDHNTYDINGFGITELKHSSTGSGGIGGSGSSRGRHTSKLGEGKVVVGFEKEVETLIQRLDNKGVGLEIISIIGAAGGGKSTLAREVYEHPFTSHTFEIRAWVNVSHDYDAKPKKKELLIGILKSASPKKHEDEDEDYEKSNGDQLGEEVHKCLKAGDSISPFEGDLWRMVCLGFHELFFFWIPCFAPCFAIDAALDQGRYIYTIKLPHNIFKMVELRHLYSKKGIFKYHLSYISSKKATRNPSKLNSLQTLHPICPCKDCRSFLVRTPNLKKLGFYGQLFSRGGVLKLPDVAFLKCLETLSFINSGFFYKHISSLPARLKLPPTIRRLTLKHTFLKWEELSILQTLPSLEVLKLLMYACEGQVWNANELEGFFQLKYLRFEYLNIVEWNATEDQFPRLEVLVLRHCRKLKGIPIDFANLNELRKIELDWCTRSAEDSAREIQEEQRNKKGDDDCLHLLSTQPLDLSCIFSTCNLSVGVIGKSGGSMVIWSMGERLGLEFKRYV
ncbi:hypothetical protein Vadar_031757 [Vaccinium darrowii]|uniref:Uncharacterized protein n=1 Tax=Vaccinium darrowii TaxID=229202 RepID=A0ACB7Y3G1_9ERIC|nr:hypothetical protein Vadar_031757 [Vaccinium darrowii]